VEDARFGAVQVGVKFYTQGGGGGGIDEKCGERKGGGAD